MIANPLEQNKPNLGITSDSTWNCTPSKSVIQQNSAKLGDAPPLILPANAGSLYVCKVYIKGLNYYAIVDSGASECIMSKTYYDSLPDPKPALEKSTMKFKIADGTILPCLGKCRIKLLVDDLPSVVTVYVSDNEDSLFLLGNPWFRENKVQYLDFQNDQLIFTSGKKWQLYKSGEDQCHFLCTVKDITIPANSKRLAKISSGNILCDLGPSMLLCDTYDDLQDDYPIDVICGTTSYENNLGKLCLFNPSSRGIKLPRGTRVARATVINADDIVDLKDKSELFLEENFPTQYAQYTKERREIDPDFRTETDLCQLAKSIEQDRRRSSIVTSSNPIFSAGLSTEDNQNRYRSAGEDPPDDESDDEIKVGETGCKDMFPPEKVNGNEPRPTDQLWPHIQVVYENTIRNLHYSRHGAVRALLLKSQNSYRDPQDPFTQSFADGHCIDVGDNKPFRAKPRRLASALHQLVDEEVTKMMEGNIITPSDSPWASPIVLVKKKDNTIRFCIDYRQVNKLTRKDAYPLPRIDDCLERLYGAKYFCTLDLASGYWQIKMADEDKEKTAFTCHKGLYEFNVMPFGLCNAPATFQRMMDKILKGLEHICLVYLDDIVIFGKTFEETCQNYLKVIERLDKFNLKLKPSKCFLFRDKVDYLGHIVSEDGIATDPQKVLKVEKWPTPSKMAHVRSFLGLTCYYQRYIPNYADIAEPMQKLVGKKVKFIWGASQQTSFDLLKHSLINAPILAFPNDSGKFILDTDASNVAIGSVLSQVQDGQEKVIAYGSKTLNRAQRNYCTTKRELLAIFHFVTAKFRSYLLQRNFLLRTDHASLTWLMNFKDHDSLLNRWVMGLQPFSSLWTLEHREGRLHGNADAMSRSAVRFCRREHCPHCKVHRNPDKPLFIKKDDETDFLDFCSDWRRQPRRVDTQYNDSIVDDVHKLYISESVNSADDSFISGFTRDDIIQAQSNDLVIKKFIALKEKYDSKPESHVLNRLPEGVKILSLNWPDMFILEDILYKKNTSNNTFKLVLPFSMRRILLRHFHEIPHSGHQGITKIQLMIRKKFYWPKMKNDLVSWVQCCQRCKQIKGGRIGNSPLTQDVAYNRNERIAFDIVGPLPETKRGNRFILTIGCYFTKWVECVALANHTADTVCDALYSTWFSRFGVPIHIHCDQAREFESYLMVHFAHLFGIDKTRCNPYRPRSNGFVERCNQTIERLLMRMVNDKCDDWDLHLPGAMQAYRSTPHSSTGCSPNLLMFGTENNTPIDLMFPPPPGVPSNQSGGIDGSCYCDYVQWLRDSLLSNYNMAREVLETSAERQELYHNRKCKSPRKFSIGQWVWYWHKPTAAKPLKSGWLGPYLIVDKPNDNTYTLQRDANAKKFNTHPDYLWLDRHNDSEVWVFGEKKDSSGQIPSDPLEKSIPDILVNGIRPDLLTEVRRSSRLASKEPINYNED